MYGSARDVGEGFRRAAARLYCFLIKLRPVASASLIINIPETKFLYYNVLISVLCRDKEMQRQGVAIFCSTMTKLSLIVLLLMPTGAFAAGKKPSSSAGAKAHPAQAAEKKQPAPAPAKAEPKVDETLMREDRARLAEISTIEKASGTARAAALKPLLSDKSPEVRGEAAEALGRTKDPAAFAELSAALKSEDDHTRWGAAQGLADLGDKKAVQPLIAALGHPERNTRWKAARALGVLKDDRAVDALAGAARSDKNKNVRLAAIEALGRIGGDKAAAAVDGLKNDPDPEIRAWAAATAKKLGRK